MNHAPRILSMKLHTSPERGRPSWLRREFGLDVDPSQQLIWVQGRPYFAGDRREIGQIQAWHAPTNRMTMLWEVVLDHDLRDDPREDLLYRTLWRRSEQVIAKLFPATETMLTPAWEPAYDRNLYHSFLTSLGYTPVTAHTWRKHVIGGA